MNVCVNGQFLPAAGPHLTVQNQSYKWGEGVFETAKVFRGKLLLKALHFERLFSSLRVLQINSGEAFNQAILINHILQLCEQNNCLAHARIRLAVFRNEDNSAGYSIEALSLDEGVNQWQDAGLVIALYPFARKNMDAFANLKTANYLPYVMAMRYALEKGMDDAVVLNSQNFLCDSSKANLFLVKGKNIYTPALHQGCVNGVMRRVVIEQAKKLGYRLYQDAIDEPQLLSADEVFLTNAIQIIRWVKTYKQRQYEHTETRRIFNAVSATIFGSVC